MPKIKNPLLFSSHFNLPPTALARAGLIDPFLNVDVPLFIDPVLLSKSKNRTIALEGAARFRNHFTDMVRLLAISKKENDAAWKGASRLLDLSEPPENGLGFGGSGRSGNSRPTSVKNTILRTSKEIIELGIDDPEMISLMGFFEEDVGADTISDLTTNVIKEDLAKITNKFCKQNGVKLFKNKVSKKLDLPKFVSRGGRESTLLLVPIDIVRELPVANDSSEIDRAAMINEELRARVNKMLAGITKPTVSERKEALKRAALSSPDNFRLFLESMKSEAQNYDPNIDALGYYKLKEIFQNGFPDLKPQQPYNIDLGHAEIMRCVKDSIMLFKRHVESGNLWEELWVDGNPKKERASQLIYYAISDAYCRANNVYISPEANMGGGPIDFKFSRGYDARVLVEMKRSGGTVVHGYEKQLEFYKEASQTEYAFFVVIDYGDIGSKLIDIQDIRDQRLKAGGRASEIIVIDATPKASSSKRK